MKKKIGKIVFAIVILAFLLIQVYPIIWLFMASVKPTIELVQQLSDVTSDYNAVCFAESGDI